MAIKGDALFKNRQSAISTQHPAPGTRHPAPSTQHPEMTASNTWKIDMIDM